MSELSVKKWNNQNSEYSDRQFPQSCFAFLLYCYEILMHNEPTILHIFDGING